MILTPGERTAGLLLAGALQLGAWVVVRHLGDLSMHVHGLWWALLPLLAGAIGGGLARRRIGDGKRTFVLLGCAVITLAGVFGYFAPSVSVVAAAIAALLFLLGVVSSPRQIMRALDPRN